MAKKQTQVSALPKKFKQTRSKAMKAYNSSPYAKFQEYKDYVVQLGEILLNTQEFALFQPVKPETAAEEGLKPVGSIAGGILAMKHLVPSRHKEAWNDFKIHGITNAKIIGHNIKNKRPITENLVKIASNAEGKRLLKGAGVSLGIAYLGALAGSKIAGAGGHEIDKRANAYLDKQTAEDSAKGYRRKAIAGNVVKGAARVKNVVDTAQGVHDMASLYNSIQI